MRNRIWVAAAALLLFCSEGRAQTPEDVVPMTPVRSTAEPSPAGDLLAAGGRPWRVTDGVASLVFRFAAGHPLLRGVLIDAGRFPDPPRGVEVLLGNSVEGPWRSVASFELRPGEGIRRETVAPSRETFALLRVSGHQPGQPAMALARLGFSDRAP